MRQSTQLRGVCVTMGKRVQSTETDVFQYTTQKGDMFKYEKTLPSLPVPPLAQTLERCAHITHMHTHTKHIHTLAHTHTHTHTHPHTHTHTHSCTHSRHIDTGALLLY